ncbi:TadE/TadG family type IV pilus assembly protein [Bacillus infantis]|uniref:TadE/TadG family type IV pilus assembly protein n=1 Tax=Bacillus infantis TaxID=324767 RepID=UPI003CECF5DF
MTAIVFPILFCALFFGVVIMILNMAPKNRLQEKTTKKYKRYDEKPKKGHIKNK